MLDLCLLELSVSGKTRSEDIRYKGYVQRLDSCIILLSMDNCNICIKLCLSHTFTHFPSYCYSMCNLSLTTHPCLTCTYTTYSAISSFLSFFSSPALSPASPLLESLLLFLANLHCLGGGSCSMPSTLCTCLKAIRRRACWEELVISSLSWLVSSCNRKLVSNYHFFKMDAACCGKNGSAISKRGQSLKFCYSLSF